MGFALTVFPKWLSPSGLNSEANPQPCRQSFSVSFCSARHFWVSDGW